MKKLFLLIYLKIESLGNTSLKNICKKTLTIQPPDQSVEYTTNII